MEFRVLGRLEVRDGDRDVTPGRSKARALLGLLLLHPNERLTTDRIIDGLWGEAPPPTADKALQGHVSSLRKLLGADRIRTERAGYRLELRTGELDVDRFTVAMDRARSAPGPAERARLLDEALGLWRGEPLADLADEQFAQSEIARLQALRVAAMEERIDAELDLGRHAELVPELERLVADHPLHEGFRAKLMLALYRAGRQSDALRAYREGRRQLAEDLGIDPGEELRLLERRILAQDAALAAPDVRRTVARRQERKVVTILVLEAEVPGATDPEDLDRAVAPAMAAAREVVERAGGTAEPLFANALIGIFGAPRAHDEDPLRAVRAGLGLLASKHLGDARLRGGIETGESLVTIEGDQVDVSGEVVQAAAHLQSSAALGSIAVGPRAKAATEAHVVYEPSGEAAWSPLRLQDMDAGGPEAPFVGRVQELSLLERIVRRAFDDRSVQLATVVAEPGAGKSRLVRELRGRLHVEAEGARWLQGRCLPYGDGLTFWALGEIAKDWAGILASDDAATSAEKLGRALQALEPRDSQRAWLARSIAPLVGIENAAPGEREQGYSAWRQLIEGIAADRPTVVVFEDIQWADAALLAFIEHLVERAAGVPLLVLCTARPELLEARPTWSGGRRNATTILLQPLSDVDTEALLHTMLGRAPTRDWVRRAGGNPLYAHVLARVIGRSETPDLTAIPESLQAVIAAHLDTLAPDVKVVAADASVIGEVFWPGAVAAINGLDPADVDVRLQRLVASEVVRRRRRSSVAGEDEYEFLHVLVRDVAYGQIPRRNRISKHRAIATWIERLAGDRTTAHAELMAHHSLEAFELSRRLGNVAEADSLRVQAVRFQALAGDSIRSLDVAKAAAFYQRALEVAPPEDPARPALLARLSEAAQLSGDLTAAESLARSAIEGLLAAGNASAASQAMVSLEAVLWRLGRPDEERRHLLTDAIAVLEPLPPNAELVKAYAQMAAHELYVGSAAACMAWSSRALDVAEALGTPSLQLQPRQYLGIARFEQGDPAGIEDVRAAVQLGLASGLSWETGHALADLGAMVWLQEGPERALPIKADAVAFAEGRGMTALAQTTRAQMLWMQFDAGAWDEMIEAGERLVAAAGDAGGRVTVMALSSRARVLVARGAAAEAVGLAEAVLRGGRAIGDAQDVAPALATAAYVQSAIGDGPAALALIEEMEERSRGRDLSRRAHDLALVARICAAHGATELARSFLPEVESPAPTRAKLAVAATRGVVMEADGDLDGARQAYASVGRGWATYGCPEEEAHALLGYGRCLAGLARPDEATSSLRRAQTIGRGLGAVGIREEAEGLLRVLSA